MKRILLLLLSVMVATQSYALWYRDNVKKGADIFMIDLCYPYWAESSYYACWNINLFPNGGYFYGGIAANMPEGETEDSYSPNSVWTFWEHEAYEKRQAVNTYVHPKVYASQYGGEGSSGAAHGEELDWVKPKRWYTMLLRSWGADTLKNESYVGWWMKDKENDVWIHYGTFRIPYAATGFINNSGFLEDFGHGGRNQRTLWRGAGFSRMGGEWFPADSIIIDVPKDNARGDYWMVLPEEEGKVLSMTHTNGSGYPRNLAPGMVHSFQIAQEATPQLDELDFTALAESDGNSIIIDWELSKHSSPQLGYTIELFDNKECKGEAITTVSQMLPQCRTKSISAPMRGGCGVRLTIQDIFDNTKSIIISDFAEVTLLKASSAESDYMPGLHYSYYEKRGGINSLDELADMKCVREGVSTGFDISIAKDGAESYGIVFDGYISVPKSGAYTFLLKSTDGSRLTVDGSVVIDNDGKHSTSDVRESVFLTKGILPVKLEYFKGRGSKTHVSLEWESADFALRAVSADELLSVKGGDMPTASLEVKEEDGTLYLAADISCDNVEEITYFNGAKELGRLTEKPFSLRVTPFGGENTFWCRVVYDKNHTIDSKKLEYSDTHSYSPEWTYANLGEQDLPYKMTYKDGEFSIAGEGEYQIYREVKGDFEISGRLLYQTTDRGMGKHWMGLMAKQGLNMNDGRDFGIYHTASSGLRSSADYDDLATTRVSFFEMDSSHKWLRIVRCGDTFTSYSSADGISWVKGLERIVKAPELLYVGITYLSTPKASNKIYSGAMADVVLKVAEQQPEPKQERFKLESDIYAYSFLDSANNIYALSSKRGVDIITRDGDKLSSKSLKLPKGVVRVRSIVKSEDNILIAATGRKSSGLYLTSDGGASWEEVMSNFAIAYRDYMCGDILCVNPDDAREILAGSDGQGLFVSKDGGRSWSLEALEGESITEVSYNPNYSKRRMVLSYDVDNSRGNIWMKNEQQPWTRCTSIDAEFTKINYASSLNVLYISSTRGLYTTYNNGVELNHIVCDVPETLSFFAADLTRAQYSYFMSDRHFVASSDGSSLYRSDRYQCLWKLMNDNLNFGNIYAVRARRADKNYVMLFTDKGIFESYDSGLTFKELPITSK